MAANSWKAGAGLWAGSFGAAAAPALEPQPADSGRGVRPQIAAPGTPLQVISRPAPRRLVGTNIDLKLLAILNELHRTRSVSHAAENLQVSQSTISMSLAKLRRHFSNPLFVRTSTGMEPTPHALEVLTLLSKAEGLIQSALEHHVIFDPGTSDRVFHLCSTDIAQLTLLPTLMKRMKEAASHIEVDLRSVSGSIPRLLESGEVDLAVGFIPPMGAGFYQQRLFRDRFVCAVRAGHPRIKNGLRLEQFERETHLTVATSGTGHSVVERTLEAKKIRRKVGLRVPSFLGIAPILTSTDFLAVLPEQLGKFFASTGKIKLLPLPFAMAPYFIQQHWHERYNHDPANVWFRNLIAELFRSPMASAGSAALHSPGVIKITLPSANQFPAIVYKKGLSERAYATYSGLLWVLVPVIHAEIAALVDEGVPPATACRTLDSRAGPIPLPRRASLAAAASPAARAHGQQPGPLRHCDVACHRVLDHLQPLQLSSAQFDHPRMQEGDRISLQ